MVRVIDGDALVLDTGQSVRLILDRELLRKKAEVLSALQRSDPTGDPDNYRALQESLVHLERDRRELREE